MANITPLRGKFSSLPRRFSSVIFGDAAGTADWPLGMFSLCMGMLILIKKYYFKLKDIIITIGYSKAHIKNHRKMGVRKYKFVHRIVTLQNKLPASCVNATSVNMFKNRIDNYFQDAGYI